MIRKGEIRGQRDKGGIWGTGNGKRGKGKGNVGREGGMCVCVCEVGGLTGLWESEATTTNTYLTAAE